MKTRSQLAQSVGFILLSVAALSLPAGLLAQVQTPTGTNAPLPVFSLGDLLKQALTRNPEVLTAQKKYEAARARPSIESSLPDPKAAFAYGDMNNPLPFATLDTQFMSDAGFDVQQEFPFPGKLKLRGQMAQQEAAAALQDYNGAQLRVASRLKQAYYQLYYVYKAQEILNRDKDLLGNFERIAESRYSVGKAQQADVFRAQLEISILLRELRRLEQEQQTLKGEINSLLDRPVQAPLGRPAEYIPAELKMTLDDLLARAAKQSPMLGREQAMVQKSSLGVQLARRDYYPDFGVMAGWRQQGAGMGSMYEARFEVSVPLYFWRKQRAAVQEQAAGLSAARHQYESTGQDLAYKLRQAYEAARTSSELLTLYAKGILPQSTLALESSLSSYQVGNLDFLTVISSFRSVLDYEVNYYQEMATFQKSLAQLEELSGVPLL